MLDLDAPASAAPFRVRSSRPTSYLTVAVALPGVGVGEGRRSGEVHQPADTTARLRKARFPECDLGLPVLYTVVIGAAAVRGAS